MIQLTAHMRVLVATEPVDFRRGIDGLAAVCRAQLGSDPLSGTVFVFCNKRRTAAKCLVYDGQGFWLCHKRLSQGRFGWWPERDAGTARGSSSGAARLLEAHEAAVLLSAGDPRWTGSAAVWRRVESRPA